MPPNSLVIAANSRSTATSSLDVGLQGKRDAASGADLVDHRLGVVAVGAVVDRHAAPATAR